MCKSSLSVLLLAAGVSMATAPVQLSHAETAPPPTLGQDTKGEPATAEQIAEAEANEQAQPQNDSAVTDGKEQKKSGRLFGTTKIKESRRESGQVYQIEIQHSAGPNQYIEETDSDGNIESEPTDIEDTPNLPKWRIGSW
ncbi:DUF2782 domain-containing protein [Arenicella chitinivorans]|nr:DUF2782 domain-containing protein [Arenicella chitinivorans]